MANGTLWVLAAALASSVAVESISLQVVHIHFRHQSILFCAIIPFYLPLQAIRQLLEHFGIHGPDQPSKLRLLLTLAETSRIICSLLREIAFMTNTLVFTGLAMLEARGKRSCCGEEDILALPQFLWVSC